MITKNILLDVDGVLADFLNPAMKAAGVNRDILDMGRWDVFRAAGIDQSEVWKKIDNYAFWSQLNLIPGAREFVNVLREHCLSVTFLTAASWSSDCVMAKTEWLDRWFGARCPKFICHGGASKALCAKPGNLLIDDCDRNTDAFMQAGGEAVLVPRPWNRDYLGGEGSTLLGSDWDHVDYNLVLQKIGIDVRIPEYGGPWAEVTK